MDWNLISCLSQSISAMLIFVAIILAYKQLKEMTNHIRTNVSENVVNFEKDFWGFFFEDKDLLKWYLKSRSIEAFSDFIQNKRIFFAILKLDFIESLYLQKINGNLKKEIWTSWFKALKIDLTDKYFQIAFSGINKNGLYTQSFSKIVKHEIAKIIK